MHYRPLVASFPPLLLAFVVQDLQIMWILSKLATTYCSNGDFSSSKQHEFYYGSGRISHLIACYMGGVMPITKMQFIFDRLGIISLSLRYCYFIFQRIRVHGLVISIDMTRTRFYFLSNPTIGKNENTVRLLFQYLFQKEKTYCS